MRRKDREITDFAQMLAIVSACDCCRIGLVDSDGAYIVPMNFGFEVIDKHFVIYFHGAKTGKKLSLLKNQQFVSFEMDRKHELVRGEEACSYSFCYQSVMGKGTIKLLEKYEEKVHGLQAIMEHYSNQSEWKFREEQVNMVSVLQLEVTEWSCKEH